jgi:hypothetical protein
MKNYVACIVAVIGSAVARPAEAENKHACCTTSNNGACVAQGGPCSDTTSYGIDLSNLTEVWSPSGDCNVYFDYPEAGIECDGWPSDPISTNATFPSGIDGYMTWSQSPPWLGLCLIQPSAQDPMHERIAEPIGCMNVSLSPGVGAAIERFEFPLSPMWDAWQLCYGSPPCANVNDRLDPSVSPTPVSGSCCAGAQLLRDSDHVAGNASEWTVSIGQALPGIPPPEVFQGPDGDILPNCDHSTGANFVTYCDPAAGYSAVPVPDVCLGAYNEPAACGTPSGQTGFGPMGVEAGIDATSDVGAAVSGDAASRNDAASPDDAAASSQDAELMPSGATPAPHTALPSCSAIEVVSTPVPFLRVTASIVGVAAVMRRRRRARGPRAQPVRAPRRAAAPRPVSGAVAPRLRGTSDG